MIARDLMQADVLLVREDESVEELVDALIGEHIHGAPVVSKDGALVGVVSQQDLFFGTMTRAKAGDRSSEPSVLAGLKVAEIMTSPAVSVDEETEIQAVCETMYRLRIHRVPVVQDGKVTGIISSLDICRAISSGKKLP